MSKHQRLAILGAGNIGTAIASGLVRVGAFDAAAITLTRRKLQLLDPLRAQGFATSSDNKAAVAGADVIVVAVEPSQIDELLAEIAPALEAGRHTVVSVVSDVPLARLREALNGRASVARAMPNTAVSIGESMTCIAEATDDSKTTELVRSLFDHVGKTAVIDEEQMGAATALGACGIAFFLRAVRAASQGGIEIGFHAKDAVLIASQTARGAASLVLTSDHHPEHEIDRVTTPRGCTIAGLNQMEHAGFSSALIKGITTSASKVSRLYDADD